ncbi:MAG: phosphonate C-P lyase system protein PhnH, partial [Phenylobacterium sp.]|nr:phosphonate C-P lyase system protein PhnH [Phenylobacterium sp.]
KYPDRSTTLVIQLPALEGGAPVVLTGPGIKTEMALALAGLPDGFWAQVQANHEQFQFGLDFIFVAGDRVTALPRSTRVTIKGD